MRIRIVIGLWLALWVIPLYAAPVPSTHNWGWKRCVGEVAGALVQIRPIRSLRFLAGLIDRKAARRRQGNLVSLLRRAPVFGYEAPLPFQIVYQASVGENQWLVRDREGRHYLVENDPKMKETYITDETGHFVTVDELAWRFTDENFDARAEAVGDPEKIADAIFERADRRAWDREGFIDTVGAPFKFLFFPYAFAFSLINDIRDRQEHRISSAVGYRVLKDYLYLLSFAVMTTLHLHPVQLMASENLHRVVPIVEMLQKTDSEIKANARGSTLVIEAFPENNELSGYGQHFFNTAYGKNPDAHFVTVKNVKELVAAIQNYGGGDKKLGTIELLAHGRNLGEFGVMEIGTDLLTNNPRALWAWLQSNDTDLYQVTDVGITPSVVHKYEDIVDIQSLPDLKGLTAPDFYIRPISCQIVAVKKMLVQLGHKISEHGGTVVGANVSITINSADNLPAEMRSRFAGLQAMRDAYRDSGEARKEMLWKDLQFVVRLPWEAAVHIPRYVANYGRPTVEVIKFGPRR